MGGKFRLEIFFQQLASTAVVVISGIAEQIGADRNVNGITCAQGQTGEQDETEDQDFFWFILLS